MFHYDMIGLICHLAVKFSTRGDFRRAVLSLHILIMSYLHGYKFIQLLSDPLSSHLVNTYFFFIISCYIYLYLLHMLDDF
ncbi:hypothetical protein Hanom_Chr12g01116671 [Helianthus anomalus]